MKNMLTAESFPCCGLRDDEAVENTSYAVTWQGCERMWQVTKATWIYSCMSSIHFNRMLFTQQALSNERKTQVWNKTFMFTITGDPFASIYYVVVLILKVFYYG